jgi:hypothetical protein
MSSFDEGRTEVSWSLREHGMKDEGECGWRMAVVWRRMRHGDSADGEDIKSRP